MRAMDHLGSVFSKDVYTSYDIMLPAKPGLEPHNACSRDCIERPGQTRAQGRPSTRISSFAMPPPHSPQPSLWVTLGVSLRLSLMALSCVSRLGLLGWPTVYSLEALPCGGARVDVAQTALEAAALSPHCMLRLCLWSHTPTTCGLFLDRPVYPVLC